MNINYDHKDAILVAWIAEALERLKAQGLEVNNARIIDILLVRYADILVQYHTIPGRYHRQEIWVERPHRFEEEAA